MFTGFQVVTPYYYKSMMSNDALVQYYTSIATSSPIPIILYNVPKFTGVELSIQVVEQLAKHPNIIGIKESSDQIVKITELIRLGKHLMRESSGFFGVFAGSGGYLLPALSVGATGGIMALANVLPAKCIQLMELFHQKRMEEALELQTYLIPVNQAITKIYGIVVVLHSTVLLVQIDHIAL